MFQIWNFDANLENFEDSEILIVSSLTDEGVLYEQTAYLTHQFVQHSIPFQSQVVITNGKLFTTKILTISSPNFFMFFLHFSHFLLRGLIYSISFCIVINCCLLSNLSSLHLLDQAPNSLANFEVSATSETR